MAKKDDKKFTYSYKSLKDTINHYGYSYTFKDFVTQAATILFGVAIIAFFSKLTNSFLFFVLGLTIVVIPFLIKAWFDQLYAVKRFEMLQSYISNVLPIFMQKPKIRFALGEVLELCNGEMEECVQKAIDYIDNENDDPDLFKNALAIIETSFPNSRVKAIHKIMLTIENGSSNDYRSVCENMYLDVENWIKRTYAFQKDLRDRRMKLIIICIMALLLNTIFISAYTESEFFKDFTNRNSYQWTTTIFIVSILITAALIIAKLHGVWLINDQDNKNQKEIDEAYDYIHTHSDKPRAGDIATAAIFGVAGLALILLWPSRRPFGFAFLLFAFIFYTQRSRNYNTKRRRVSRALLYEFPIWLRDIALNLSTLTVINAIDNSREYVSYPMRKEIELFLAKYNENPNSIVPYNEFLKDYELEDVQSSMKVLYTIASLGQAEIKDQISLLISRNQEILNKTEQMRNEESIAGVEMLGYLPMIFTCIQLMVSMVLMFAYIMEYLNALVDASF